MARYRLQFRRLAGPAQKLCGAGAILRAGFDAISEFSHALLMDLLRGGHLSVLPVPVATKRRRTGSYR